MSDEIASTETSRTQRAFEIVGKTLAGTSPWITKKILQFSFNRIQDPRIMAAIVDFSSEKLMTVATAQASRAISEVAIQEALRATMSTLIATVNFIDIALIVVFVVAFLYEMIDPRGFNELQFRENIAQYGDRCVAMMRQWYLERLRECNLPDDEQFPWKLELDDLIYPGALSERDDDEEFDALSEEEHTEIVLKILDSYKRYYRENVVSVRGVSVDDHVPDVISSDEASTRWNRLFEEHLLHYLNEKNELYVATAERKMRTSMRSGMMHELLFGATAVVGFVAANLLSTHSSGQ